MNKVKLVNDSEMQQLQIEAAAKLFFARLQPAYALATSASNDHNPLDGK